MASKRSTVEFLVEQCAGAGKVAARAMFGEYALYCDDKVVGLICDDQLYIKLTQAGRFYIGQAAEAAPYSGAKPHLLIPGDAWDDSAWLSQLVRITAASLPAKPKKRTAK